jgi:hypothetical protein
MALYSNSNPSLSKALPAVDATHINLVYNNYLKSCAKLCFDRVSSHEKSANVSIVVERIQKKTAARVYCHE